jgi:SnoaL-like polyketide cyclase
LTGTFSGAPFYGVAATGRRIDIRGMDNFTVRDGKVVSVFAAYDSMDFSIQAGLLPPMESPAQRAMIHAINAMTAVRRRLRR